jgi:ATP-dependent DNA helicase RecG
MEGEKMENEKLFSELISKEPDEHLEIKPDINFDVIAKTLCGFLNREGGYLILGAHFGGEIQGIGNPKGLVKSLEKHLYDKIIPRFSVSMSIESINNKEILCLKVNDGTEKPYVYNATIYTRNKTRTERASNSDVKEMINCRNKTDIRWERALVGGFEYHDLKEKTIFDTIDEINKKGRTKRTNRNIEDFLIQYNFMINNSFTNACVLLFAKDPAQFLPGCCSRIAVFEGEKTDSIILNDKTFDKNLFSNVVDIMNFFKSSVGTFSEFINEDWQRHDYSYPFLALREAVVNAIIHRDYSNPSGNMLISIYSDRLEIMNNGALPEHLNVSDLKKNHLSYPRNPDIAQIFFLRGWIDKLGRGTLKIIQDFNDSGLPSPKWESKRGGTNLILRKFIAKNEIRNESLNSRQKKIISLTKAESLYKVSEIISMVGGNITDRSIRGDLVVLIAGGWFAKEGKGKNTAYIRLSK